jgi:pseudaminic acid synthase
VDLLMDLNAPAFKIASFEAIDLPLIRYVASTGRPMIISTGMADGEEIEEAAQAARDGGCTQFALLHCVSGYPAPASDYNLATIPDMARHWGVPVGISDHTLDNTTAVAGVVLGASIIEKHFTLDRAGGGPDDSFSLEPQSFGQLCRDVSVAWSAIGSVNYGLKSSEQGNIKFRRSLYVVENIAKGELLSPSNVRSIRPGYGLTPKHYEEVIGLTAKRDLKRGEPLTWDCVIVN